VYTAVFGLESTAKQIFIKDKLAAGDELPAGWEIDVKNCFKKFAAETMRVQAKESNSRVDGTPSSKLGFTCFTSTKVQILTRRPPHL
jgi:hypothetical protein